MNILGHAYVATKAISGDRQLLIVGSLLPESFPFIAENPFVREEIHEGGERLFEFLERNYPRKRDLALGMMAHSVADGWNKEIEKYAGGQRKELLDKIAEASRVDLKTAELRLHNFLWWGVDLWLLENKQEFVNEVAQVLQRVDIGEISRLLTECFGKDYEGVLRVVEMLFREIYRPEDLTSVEGLAWIWARQAAGLPERDQVDILKAKNIIQECRDLLGDEVQELLNSVVKEVRKNLRKF